MWDSKLCLSLLLLPLALTLNHRYKAYHKYEYTYEAESLNAINGASYLRNGPTTTCKVEIEVPQACSFIIRTTDCSLSEVIDMDTRGNPIFSPALSSDDFAAEMKRYPLKFVVEGVYDVKLYPEDGETTTILNIKRGIISALAVPLMGEEKNTNMPTIHGMCQTSSTINAREDIATDVSLSRDLSKCDRFIPIRDHTSPLALISGMHYPLAQLVRSSQSCNYNFDNEKKHMTSGSCTENHILIPFSSKGKYGVTNVGKQKLTLVEVSAHNDRVFDRTDKARGLYMDAVEDKTVFQDKDAALDLLRQLATLPETEGDKRALLFHKLVIMVRGMKAETLSPAIPEALAVSPVLTYQVLAQCGTPECSSAIMQILRGYDSSALQVDATVFALGLVSNPSALLISDMLEMAKYKPSRAIMYALSNVVKRFYQTERKLIPEIRSVAKFMATQLGDCSGNKDTTFMTLRVIGNMAPAVMPASPSLRSAVIKCVNQPAASLAVQQAAIQAHRLSPIPEEGREVLMQVVLDTSSPTQKRIAAYLVLMKKPQPSELIQLVDAIANEQDKQVKNFVISHMTNILSSSEPETQVLRQMLRNALQGNEIGPIVDPTKFSRNYKVGSVEGNMIFEGTSYLPKEMMLEMTLKAFGFDIDMMEIGMEGTGFEPTVEALFGDNGFFPDTVLKTMYFVSDNMPFKLKDVLQNIVPALRNNRVMKQTPENFMREIGRNFNKLVRELKTQQSPEAMMHLRLLGNELGYLRTKDMEEMAYSAVMMIDSLFKMVPTDLMMGLMTKADNTMFAHYIFMDNEFFLPTLTGVPLRIALSGTFTPGIKGGLKIARDMSEVAFMPSAGVEFVTQIGTHMPEYVSSGLEMHTNLFHESGLTAKISMKSNQIKMTIPAPTSPTKLIAITNTLVAVTDSEVKTIPPLAWDKVDVRKCMPVFAGIKGCMALQYTQAFYPDAAPYFPFTGDSKFSVELHPTGEVTEYTATATYELLWEGDRGGQKVDSVKFTLRAEGDEPTEATTIIKYNRKTNDIAADIQIPDYDVEAGLRLGVVDVNANDRGSHIITLDFVNKNFPELSLIGRANLRAMKEGMLQVQFIVPSVRGDATVTANMKYDEEMELELKNEFRLLEYTSEQKITMKYDTEKMEVELKSDMNSEMLDFLPYAEQVNKYSNGVLDMGVGITDMTFSQISKALVEGTNNIMEKYNGDIPYIQNVRMPSIPEISLPETLFFNVETKAVYFFNNDRFTMAIPLPLGGKSTEDLNFPPALTTPHMSLPQFGLEIGSMEIPIPELFVPESLTLTIPFFGKAEVSALMKSNLYNVEFSAAAGKDVMETPSYAAKFNVKGTSQIDILSIDIEGLGMLATSDALKAQLKGSLTHEFLEASINIIEEATLTNKMHLRSSNKINAKSKFGLNIDIEHDGMAEVNTEEIFGDSTLKGMFTAGPIYGKTVSTQSASIFPFRPEAKIDSSVQLDSSIFVAQNTIAASFVKGEFSVVSNSKAFEDFVTHDAELSFKDSKLSLKSDANALALGLKIRNQAQASAGAGEVVMRMETNADHTENRVYSLLTASLDVNGLAVNSDGTIKILGNEGTHKAALTMNKDGLTMSGTNALQSPLSIENTFNAGLDASKATLSTINKAAISDIKVDNSNTLTVTLSGLDFNSEADVSGSEYASYTHDITVDLKPYTASANANNNLKLLAIDFSNEAQLKAELYKLDLTGTLKATYGEEELKHVYQVTYADMVANAKCSTTGKLFGTQMNQNTELEIMGLAARLTNDARFNSQPIRFDETIRFSIIPFDVNLDAVFNADGDMTMYGKHSAQLYGKVLLRVQPLAFASTHEYKASATQHFENGLSLETTIDNRIDSVLSTQEQRASFRMKSKMNDHMFNQDMSLYNYPEQIGMEMSGILITPLIKTETSENQEFSASGYLKYDKSSNSHTIHLPLIENLSVVFEGVRISILHIAEALQSYINNGDIRANLESLPQRASEFVAHLNIEGNLIKLKWHLQHLNQKHFMFVEDVEALLTNLLTSVGGLMADMSANIKHFSDVIKDIIVTSSFPENLIETIVENLTALDENDIKSFLLYIIDILMDIIDIELDFEELSPMNEILLDGEREIKAKLRKMLNSMTKIIEDIDMQTFVADLKSYRASFDFKAHIEELVSVIPTQILSSTIDYFKDLLQEYDIVDRINSFYAKVRELMLQFEVDKTVQDIIEKVVELIKRFRLEETIRVVARTVTDIAAQFLQGLQSAIDYVKATEIEDIIPELNMYLGIIEQKLTSFDYNDFVDHSDRMIAEYISSLNKLIVSLEVSEKLEAVREFANFVFSTIRGSIEQFKEISMEEFIKTLKDIIDNFVFSNLIRFGEYMKDEITKLDLNAKMNFYLQLAKTSYSKFIIKVTDMVNIMVEFIKKVAPEQKIVSELLQITDGLITGVKNVEISVPSFTIPLTNLVVPSMKVSMDTIQHFEVPTQLDIPEFTILGFHVVQASTISTDDIKQKIIDLIDFFLNFEMKLLDMGTSFEGMTMSYLPALPEFSLPEFTLPEFSFPTLPIVPADKLVETLQLPAVEMPVIPDEIQIPAFGKLSFEIKLNSPIYNIRNNAEVQNSLDIDNNSQLTGFLNSQGTCLHYEILNFNLDCMARIANPKRGHIIAAETVKFTHDFLAVDHSASVTFSNFLPRASAKTTVKATTALYDAEVVNEAFIATKGGLSATVDTTYKHVLNLLAIGLSGKTSMTQKLTAHQEGTTITITVGNQATDDFHSRDSTHKSDLQITVSPTTMKMTFVSDTDTIVLKTEQTLSVDLDILHYFKLDVRSELAGTVIKNSLLEGSINADLEDMKLEVRATHNTDLDSIVDGVLQNTVDFTVNADEVMFNFKNKGNTKVTLIDSYSAKIDLQNDYSATFRPDTQHVNTLALVRVNQCKLYYTCTLENNDRETTVVSTFEGEANLDFITKPISIPEIDIPFVAFHTPGISNLDLYNQTGLKNILSTTEQFIDMDAKIAYKKSQVTPFIDIMGLIQIHQMDSVITDLSFKSAMINLNVNAGLYAEDDLVFRLGATTASTYESLNAKLDGTTSLTTKRGIKLANSLSLENRHIEGTHDSTISLSTETLETTVSVATVANIALEILNLEANQNLVADNKAKANAVSTFRMKGDFNIPVIKAVGKADADHSLKLDGTLKDVSMESFTRANMDGTILDDLVLLGILDNEVDAYLNGGGLRSTSKVIADVKLTKDTTKLISMDVNENLAIEASLKHLYVTLKYAGNNEANLFDFNTKGKHVVQATIDLVPMSSFTSNIEIEMSQPSSLGDFTFSEKSDAELTATKQKIITNTKFVSPLYITNLETEIERVAPVLKVILRSSASSVFVFLNYDLGYDATMNLEDAGITMTGTGAFTHTDLIMNMQHSLSHTLRDSRITLNVDVTSPSFTDVKLRCAVRKDGMSATISIPSTGFLGLQLHGRAPSQMTARLYGRYASDPGNDLEILTLRASAKEVDKLNLMAIFNLGAPDIMLSGLQERVPAITSSFSSFAEKYQLLTYTSQLKMIVTDYIDDAFNVAQNHAPHLSQVSVLYRNTVVQFQTIVQFILDTSIKVMRDTQVKLPGSDETRSVLEVLNNLTTNINTMLQKSINTIIVSIKESLNVMFRMISTIQVTMPISDVMAGAKLIDDIRDKVKTLPNPFENLLKRIESLDMILEKMGDTLKNVVDEGQDFVDYNLTSEVLDTIAVYLNALYDQYINLLRTIINHVILDSETAYHMVCLE
ncbi:apolipoprotein B-100-like [Aulostomus maculatus]